MMTSLAWVALAVMSAMGSSIRANSWSAARRGCTAALARARPLHPPALNLGLWPSYARYATLDPHPAGGICCRTRNNISRNNLSPPTGVRDNGLIPPNPQPAPERPLSSTLDAIDWKILKEMQDDGRITNVELARRVGISAPPCLRRVRALEEAGYIKGYRALLDEKLLGYEVAVFAMV